MIDRYLSPEDRRRVISALVVVLCFISLAAFFAFIVVPGLRYRTSSINAPVVPGSQSETGWLDPTAYPPAHRKVIPPVDPETVMKPNPELVKRGQEIYRTTCATCHGAEGKGNGPGAQGLTPKPRDFSVAEGWKNGSHVVGIYKTLEEGIPKSSMASYKDLRRKDRMAVVHYVRSLGKFQHPPSDPKALETLERSFATAETIPNRIPVAQAMELLVQEFPSVPGLARAGSDPLLQRVLSDPRKAALTLAGIPGWQSSDEKLAQGVVATLPGNGFDPSLVTSPPHVWRQLREALR